MAACPRCRTELTFGGHSGWTANGCDHCGGVWLDAHTARSLLAPLTDLTISTDATRALLRCPSCGSAMGPRVTAAAGVEVDECPPHGVWFDHDELVKISTAVSRLRGTAPPPGHVAYANWGPAVAVGSAALGAAAVTGLAGAQQQQQQSTQDVGDIAEVALYSVDVGADAAELVGDGLSTAAGGGGAVLEGAGELAGGALEVAGSALEGVFEILGGILEGLS